LIYPESVVADITIAVPQGDVASAVEIEVTITGRNTRDRYRVITVPNAVEPGAHRVECLQQAVLSVRPGWQLITIGDPGTTGVPLLFRLRTNRQTD
jgi:hypothetical protein